LALRGSEDRSRCFQAGEPTTSSGQRWHLRPSSFPSSGRYVRASARGKVPPLFARAASVSSRACGMKGIGLLSAATASSPRVPWNAFEGRAPAVEHHLWCATPLEVSRRGRLPRRAGVLRPLHSVSTDAHDRGTALRRLCSRTCLQLETSLARETRVLLTPQDGNEEAHDILLRNRAKSSPRRDHVQPA